MDFAGDRAVLKISDHRGEGVIVRRIQIVNDGFRQRILLVEPVEVGGEGLALRPITDGIEAGVRAELFEQSRVGATQRAEVKLLRPAL